MSDTFTTRPCNTQEEKFAWQYALMNLDEGNQATPDGNLMKDCVVIDLGEEKRVSYLINPGFFAPWQRQILVYDNAFHKFLAHRCSSRYSDEVCFAADTEPKAGLDLSAVGGICILCGCSAERTESPIGPVMTVGSPYPDVPTPEDLLPVDEVKKDEGPSDSGAEAETPVDAVCQDDGLPLDPGGGDMCEDGVPEPVPDVPQVELPEDLPSELFDVCESVTDMGEEEGAAQPDLSPVDSFDSVDVPVCTPKPEICNGLDDDCDGIPDNFIELGDPCTTSDKGECQTEGVIACDPTVSAELFCKPFVVVGPVPEECNGLDDDCDGITDNGFLDTDDDGSANCLDADDDGDGILDDVDNCPLVPNPLQEDLNGNKIGDLCEGDVDGDKIPDDIDNCLDVPNYDQADDDGDGVGNACDGCNDVDHDGAMDPNQECKAGVGACETTGLILCDTPVTTKCGAIPGDPKPEECNGVDDDCDGKTDEKPDDDPVGGFMTKICGTAVGICHMGIETCLGGEWGACVGSYDGLGYELCNGKDDDCDGKTDEDFPELGTVCSVGSGICYAEGSYECKPDGTMGCSATPGASGAEKCNGKDDDCDGKTDEDFSELGTFCSVGSGVCYAEGAYECKPDGTVDCSAIPGTPGIEKCNGKDDDCDGKTDENFPELGTFCSVGSGICYAEGLYECKPDGSVGCSAVPIASGVEKCNGKDDDCDGKTDEDFPELGTVCSVGAGICYAEGLYECKPEGTMGCSAVPGASKPEECNGKDDDCDGKTDEIDNINVFDLDGDGICDEMDIDVDGDGVFNTLDNCPLVPNPLQGDMDGDNVGDACDDSDGDGVVDALDNCPSVANADQKNTYGGAAGDVCDDTDLDGIVDASDNCPTAMNPHQCDLDKDGKGDACDQTVNGMLKLYTYINMAGGETEQIACQTTPLMFVTSFNGVTPQPDDKLIFNPLIDRTSNGGHASISLVTPCSGPKPEVAETVALSPDTVANWKQDINMTWFSDDVTGGLLCLQRIKLTGVLNNYKARFYFYSKNVDGTCNLATTAQEYGSPFYDLIVLTDKCPWPPAQQ
jgi:hypothetical protein